MRRKRTIKREIGNIVKPNTIGSKLKKDDAVLYQKIVDNKDDTDWLKNEIAAAEKLKKDNENLLAELEKKIENDEAKADDPATLETKNKCGENIDKHQNTLNQLQTIQDKGLDSYDCISEKLKEVRTTDEIKKIAEGTDAEIKVEKEQLDRDIAQKEGELNDNDTNEDDKPNIQAELAKMKKAKELLQSVVKKEDLAKKNYSYYDYAYAGGIRCAVAGAWATNKIAKSFGSTPQNDLQQIPAMKERIQQQNDIVKEARKYKKDKLKYHKDVSQDLRSDLEKINRKIEAAQEERNSIAQELKEANKDGDTEKIKILTAKLESVDGQLAGYIKERDDKKKEVKESEEKIDDIYDKLGDPDTMTEAQYVSKANSIN
ncbi:5948_t:CDS:2 [Ambispora gerdemannii]|uniref:5948_t:CDS:1 n=1 Tax=Ambispora gerdemannii TaxID=144530 RepID=A0A9N8V2W1_9GLOM|nr:5948_t:CDS:2 [Ambispora gerdemannii]